MVEYIEKSQPREYLASRFKLVEDDATWLTLLYSPLEVNESWLRRVNKHLAIACQSDRKKTFASQSTVQNFRFNVFGQMGLLDEAHPLHAAWLHQLNEDPENCMSPEYFIANARRLHERDSDIISVFDQNPHLFERYGEFGHEDVIERLTRVLHASNLVDVVLAEMPHLKHENPYKLIVMARTAIELYGAQDFSDPQRVVEFLHWSPEALLRTALEKDAPKLDDVRLTTIADRQAMTDPSHDRLPRVRRRKLVGAMADSTQEDFSHNKSMQAYFRYFPMNPNERQQVGSSEQDAQLPKFNESHFSLLKQLIGNDVTLDETWLEQMNQLIKLGSSSKRGSGQANQQYRRQFFEALGLHKHIHDAGRNMWLPPPGKFIEFIDLLQGWHITNAVDILSKSLEGLRFNSNETNNAILTYLQENGWNPSDPEVQVHLPRVFSYSFSTLRNMVRPRGDGENVSFWKTRERLRHSRPQAPHNSEAVGGTTQAQPTEQISEPTIVLKEKEDIPILEPPVQNDTEEWFKAARYIASVAETNLAPESILEVLALDKLSGAQARLLIEHLNRLQGEVIKLKDVRTLIAGL